MTMTAEQQLIIARLDTLSKDIELARQEQKSEKSKADAASPWYVKWAGILGVPAVVFAMLVSWSQATLNSGSTEKTAAETQKIRIESLKTQADLQKQLDELQKARTSDLNGPGLNDTLANIKSTISDIERLREAEVKGALTNIVMRVVIIWFVLRAVGIVLSIFSGLWNTVFISAVTVLQQTAFRRDEPIWRLFRIASPIVAMITNLVPTVVSWWVTIFIIFAVAQPIAYEASLVIGRPQEFTGMVAAAQQRQFAKAASHLIALLGANTPVQP
jgi:hypothetical protein